MTFSRSILVVEVHANENSSKNKPLVEETKAESTDSVLEKETLTIKKETETQQKVDAGTNVIIIENIRNFHSTLDANLVLPQRYLISKDSPPIDHIMPSGL